MRALSFFSSSRRPQVFFVVGHPRSGTNWVCNLLNLHPLVFCQGEFHFHDVHQSVERITAEPWRGAAKEPARSALRGAFAALVRSTLIAAAARKPGATRLGDRTPRHLVPLIPGCRHLVCVRDGRDVLVSWTFHMLKTGGPWLTQGPFGPGMSALKADFERDPALFDREPHRLLSVELWLRHYARQWSQRITADREVTRRMESDPRLGSALWVSYESLHADVGAGCARMYAYLGVDPARARRPGSDAHTRPGYTLNDPRAFFRSGKVGDWRRFFTDDQAQAFHAEAGAANTLVQGLSSNHRGTENTEIR